MPVLLIVLLLAAAIMEAPRHTLPRPPTDCPDCRPAIRSASVA